MRTSRTRIHGGNIWEMQLTPEIPSNELWQSLGVPGFQAAAKILKQRPESHGYKA